MARVKGAMMTRKRRNATLKLAKGYWGSKSKHFKMAKQQVMKSGNYAFKGRKLKKRDYEPVRDGYPGHRRFCSCRREGQGCSELKILTLLTFQQGHFALGRRRGNEKQTA